MSPVRVNGAQCLGQYAGPATTIIDRRIVRPPWTCRYNQIAELIIRPAYSADSQDKHPSSNESVDRELGKYLDSHFYQV